MHSDIDPIESEFGRGFLARYFAGECGRAERQRFERWAADQPERQALVEQLRSAWQLFGEADREPHAFDTQSAWAKLSGGMHAEAQLSTRPVLRLTVNRKPGVVVWARRAAVAASVLLAAGAGSWLALRGQSAGAPAIAARPREIATHPGQRADLYLSDGTHVTLGAASRLRFKAPLGAESRDVYLEGEAVFEVQHHADWPFVVHTAHAVTEDLGTRFSVRAYASDSVVTVAVAEGQVALRRDAQHGAHRDAVLGAGDLGRLTTGGHLETLRRVPLESYFAWTDGRLVFVDTRLSDALRQIARWRDLDIRVRGLSADTVLLSAAFTTESTDELLRNTALTLGLRYERHGRLVVFQPK